MSHQIQNFDFYKPVLSTDIVRVDSTVSNSSSIPKNPSVGKSQKKANKPKREKSRLPEMMETQQDIENWIAARKKNFPTRSRTNTKLMDQTERDQRGAIPLDDESKKPKIRRTEGSTKMLMKAHSFLDDLTKDEERKERSIVLQCFRYFVQHDFLQREPNCKSDSTAQTA